MHQTLLRTFVVKVRIDFLTKDKYIDKATDGCTNCCDSVAIIENNFEQNLN